MAWTLTSGTVTGQAGSLITLLDLELVTNRGWTKEFTDTNKAVYRNSANAEARVYFRVQDAGTTEANVRGYYGMTDVDTGTNPFPNTTQISGAIGGVYVRKSSSADATARPYIAAGDDRTLVLFIAPESGAASSYHTYYFGDGDSYIAGDAQFAVCAGRTNTGSGSHLSCLPCPVSVGADGALNGSVGNNLTVSPDYNYGVWMGGTAGVPGSQAFNILSPGGVYGWVSTNSGGYAGAIGGAFDYPTPGGQLLLAELEAFYGSVARAAKLRGRLRGIWYVKHPATSFGNGDTVSGTGELAGKSFQIIKSVVCTATVTVFGTTSASGIVAVSTNDPD
jgi:hypothetical protein